MRNRKTETTRERTRAVKIKEKKTRGRVKIEEREERKEEEEKIKRRISRRRQPHAVIQLRVAFHAKTTETSSSPPASYHPYQETRLPYRETLVVEADPNPRGN